MKINVYTDDNSRVHLKDIPGEAGSDYINASFITVRMFWTFCNYIFTCFILCCRDMGINLEHTLHHKVRSTVSFTLMYTCQITTNSSLQDHLKRQLMIFGGWYGSTRFKPLSC